jgi:hypothetical protein
VTVSNYRDWLIFLPKVTGGGEGRHQPHFIVAALERQLAKSDNALVGNSGFRRHLKTISNEHFAIDPDKIGEERKFDGIFVLRTKPISTRSRPCSEQAAVDGARTFRTAKHSLAIGRSSISSMRLFAVTCSEASSRWC